MKQFLRSDVRQVSSPEAGNCVRGATSRVTDIQEDQLPRGVTVALQILDLFVMVRIHARQPIGGGQCDCPEHF